MYSITAIGVSYYVKDALYHSVFLQVDNRILMFFVVLFHIVCAFSVPAGENCLC